MSEASLNMAAEGAATACNITTKEQTKGRRGRPRILPFFGCITDREIFIFECMQVDACASYSW